MAMTTYVLRHKRDNLEINRTTFEGARLAFVHQWRDQDGSIPWRMFAVTWEVLYTRVRSETEVDPWTGTIRA